MKIIFYFSNDSGFVAFDLKAIQHIIYSKTDNVISVLMKGAVQPAIYNFGSREENSRNAKLLLDAWTKEADSMTVKPGITPNNSIQH